VLRVLWSAQALGTTRPHFYEFGALAWLCENRTRHRLRTSPKKFPDARIESSVDAALNDPEIRGIVIATPAETHYRLARAAIEAGKDVLSKSL